MSNAIQTPWKSSSRASAESLVPRSLKPCGGLVTESNERSECKAGRAQPSNHEAPLTQSEHRVGSYPLDYRPVHHSRHISRYASWDRSRGPSLVLRVTACSPWNSNRCIGLHGFWSSVGKTLDVADQPTAQSVGGGAQGYR